MSELQKLIEGVATSFDEFKKTHTQMVEEERKGNTARAKELAEKLDKIETEIVSDTKARKELERRLAVQQERIEILESVNDRPKGTVQDRIRGEHMDLFLRWLRSGGKDHEVHGKYRELQAKAAEVKDVTIGTNIAGGFALPEEIGTTVDKLLLKMSDILNYVKNVRVGTSDYKELISIHGGNSGWVGETGTRSATNTPNLRERAPTWGELYAYPQVSEWSLQDIFFNVTDWLTSDIADGMAQNLSAAIWSGSGTNRPTGMTNTTPVTTADHASPHRAAAAYQFVSMAGLAPTSPNVIHMDSIINLVYTLNPKYRSNARFAMNTTTQGIVRRLKTSQGVYLWEPSMQVGQPDRLLGYPVFTWEDMGNANTVDAFCVAFGDFAKGYVLSSRSELLITTDQVTNPGYTRFYVRRRYGGCPLNNDAVKFLRNAD